MKKLNYFFFPPLRLQYLAVLVLHRDKKSHGTPACRVKYLGGCTSVSAEAVRSRGIYTGHFRAMIFIHAAQINYGQISQTQDGIKRSVCLLQTFHRGRLLCPLLLFYPLATEWIFFEVFVINKRRQSAWMFLAEYLKWSRQAKKW